VVLNNDDLKTHIIWTRKLIQTHPDSGIIGICIYPSSFNHPTLGLLYDPTKWEYKLNSHWDYFGFGRKHGTANNIILGIDTDIGTARFTNDIPTQQNILLHIYDPVECNRYNEAIHAGEDLDLKLKSQNFSTVAIP